MTNLTCFKAYDIRGKLGEEINEKIAYNIGRAFAQHINAKCVVVGADIRLTSNELKQALAKGIMDAGADVIDIGMSGSEEVYFATFDLGVDGGVEVTASHNPIDYNGMKLVGHGAKPISGDSGLKEIQRLAQSKNFTTPDKQGSISQKSIEDDYVSHLLGYINTDELKPLKLVVNSGNGAAGHVIDAIEARFRQLGLGIEFIKVHHQPDGTFPNGIPNPLLTENRKSTSDVIKANGADMGIAWDGDFDRCFLFDEKGSFIEGYYIVGLLAEAFLQKHKGAKIIHDPRLIWNTIDIVTAAGGTPIQSKSGHAFIKERMRAEDAIYGGEMSAHHYFKDFSYCDSGMIPWLLILELMSKSSRSLSSMVNNRMAAYPCSGEINYKVDDTNASMEKVKAHFADLNPIENNIDGLSLEFPDWRFSLRSSNTEPLLRLNVETRADVQLVKTRVEEIGKLILETG